MENSPSKQLGQSLQSARLLKNLTQTELALRGGVSERVIKKLEAGQNVSMEVFLSVAEVLGYLPDFLFLMKQDKPATIEQHQALAKGMLARRKRAR